MSKEPFELNAFTVEDELLTIDEVCIFFGGKSKPLNPATLYKGIKAGRFPAPIKIGPQTARWLRSEVETYRRKMIEGRDTATPLPTGKRKKR